MLFLIDLPRKANETVDDTTPFRDELVYFLRASTLNEKIIDKMLQHDFSKTAKYAFVHSMWVLYSSFFFVFLFFLLLLFFFPFALGVVKLRCLNTLTFFFYFLDFDFPQHLNYLKFCFELFL